MQQFKSTPSLVIVGLLFLIGFVWVIKSSSLISSSSSAASHRQWQPKFPDDIDRQLHAMFGSDTKRERAALQHAHALWNFLDSEKSLAERTRLLDRSVTCLYSRFNLPEEVDTHKAIRPLVLSSTELVRRYYIEDKRTSGQLTQAIPVEGSCDP